MGTARAVGNTTHLTKHAVEGLGGLMGDMPTTRRSELRTDHP
jgi:hypothetical protein